MNDFLLVYKNLFWRKLRTWLMIVSILVAFAIFGALGAFYRAFNAGEDLAAANRLLVVNKINFSQSMPVSYYTRVRGVAGVSQVTYASWFGGYFQDPKNFLTVFAVEPASYFEVYRDDLDVDPTALNAFVQQRSSAIVGEKMAAKWGWKVGDRIPVSSNVLSQKTGSRTWDFDIVGIAKAKGEQANTNVLLFQYDYLNETRSFGKDTIGWMVLQTGSSADNDGVAKTIDTMFANSGTETSTDTEKAFGKAFAAQYGNVSLIIFFVVGAAFVTILMIVGNTMALSVRERTRQIGVLKTLGFSGPRILSIILGEAVLLALIGGAGGLVVASVVAAALRSSTADIAPSFSMSPAIVLSGVGLMVALGLITGIVPAYGAMRLKIAAALGRG